MIRVCPHSDARCVHGMSCAYTCATDNYDGNKNLSEAMSAETLIDRLDALWLEMNDAVAEPPATARVLNAIHDAAQALRTPPAPTEAVAWRDIATAPRDGTGFLVNCPHVEDGVSMMMWDANLFMMVSLFDGKPWVSGLERPTHWQPLPTPPSADAKRSEPDALPGDLRERVAAIIDANKYEAWTVDRANQMADAILSLIQSERGEP